MNRTLVLLTIILTLAACQKNNPPQATSIFYISVDTVIGSASASRSPNSFLIHLKHPPQVAAVPVLLHIPSGGHPDQGRQINDSTWLDTVNISQNAVANVNVTVNGQTNKYGVAYEYLFSNYWGNSLGRSTTYAMFFAGDTLYVGGDYGLSYSIDNGVTFSSVSALAATAASHQQGHTVNGIYVSGTNIYASSIAAMFISRDRGKTFSDHSFDTTIGGTLTLTSVSGFFAQSDTLYVATDRGLRVSRDKGNSFSSNISTGLGDNGVDAVWAVGDTVYAATGEGLSISVDGGAHFFNHTDGLPMPDCFALSVQNEILYVGTIYGMGMSFDNGSTFHLAGLGDGLEGIPVYAVAVEKNLLCVGTNSGMFLSTDGGASFIKFTPANGLGNYGIGSIAIRGTTIFIGCQHYYSPDTPGGMTIMTPRL